MKKIIRTKIAICSLGYHTNKNILPFLKKSKSFDLIGGFTRNKKNYSQINSLDLSNFIKFKSFLELLNHKGLDLVYIASPPAFLYDYVIKAIEHNINVIVEKPFYIDQKKFENINKISKKKNLLIYEALMYKHHCLYDYIDKFLNKNDKYFGRINSIKSTFGIPHLSNSNFRYSKKMGGGALNDLGVYPISLISSLISNKYKIISAKKYFDSKFKIDTLGEIIVRDVKNKISFYGNWYFGFSYQNKIEINCENRDIVIHNFFSKPINSKSEIQIQNHNKIEKIIKFPYENHFENMFLYCQNKINKKNKIKLEKYIHKQLDIFSRFN
tara:strand:+ start:7559 stop:8536 length:978 start_codon:yes stop_codon:yes gene_type:complete